jgi:hypothetical protein
LDKLFLRCPLQIFFLSSWSGVKFHKNPISGLGGVALTRYMDGWTGWFLYTPPNFVCGGYNNPKLDCSINYWKKPLEQNKHFTDIDDNTTCVFFPDTIIYPQTADDDLVFAGSILWNFTHL